MPLDSVKGTLRLSLSQLLCLLGRCLGHRLRICCAINGRRACSLIFCLIHLTHYGLKRPLICDFSKSVTSSCCEGTDTHLLKPALSALEAAGGHSCLVLLETSPQGSGGVFGW